MWLHKSIDIYFVTSVKRVRPPTQNTENKFWIHLCFFYIGGTFWWKLEFNEIPCRQLKIQFSRQKQQDTVVHHTSCFLILNCTVIKSEVLSWNIAIQDVIMAEYHSKKKKKKQRSYMICFCCLSLVPNNNKLRPIS